MTAFAAKSFTVACSSGGISDAEARARWEAVFGPRPEKTMERDPAAQTLHFQPCSCQECQTVCRKCGGRTNELRDGRIVLVTHGRCGPCADLER